MADDRHLEKSKKWLFLGNGLPDLLEIWQGDKYWPSDGHGH